MTAEPRPRIAIAEALRNHWFEIWYQPKVDLKRKCLAGAEALARIRHPQLGVLPPGRFVPAFADGDIAELSELGLVATLCDWTVFDQASFNLHLAVNVPVSVLPGLPIQRLVCEHRPKSTRWPGLILELTENQIVADMALAGEIAGRLRASGVTIAIDDCGAASSALASLAAVPFSEFKLARGWVRGCATDAANGAICRSAIELAHRFGAAAAADGVESAADLQALIAMGCDFAQGPVIAPFLPKQEFLDLLRLRNSPRPTTPKDVIQAGAKLLGRVA